MTICKQISWPDDAAGVDSKKLLFKNQASPENFIHDTIYYLTDSPHQIFLFAHFEHFFSNAQNFLHKSFWFATHKGSNQSHCSSQSNLIWALFHKEL